MVDEEQKEHDLAVAHISKLVQRRAEEHSLKVWLLWVHHEDSIDPFSYQTDFLGIYTSREKAKAAAASCIEGDLDWIDSLEDIEASGDGMTYRGLGTGLVVAQVVKIDAMPKLITYGQK